MPSNVRIKLIESRNFERRMRWNRVRINELCNIASITERELVAYLDWKMPAFRQAYRSNTFPGHICLALDVLDAAARKTFLGEQVNFDLPFSA